MLDPVTEVEQKVTQFQQVVEALRTSIGEVVVGQEAVINDVLTALFAGGHVLSRFEGVHRELQVSGA